MLKSLMQKVQPKRELLEQSTLSPKQPILSLLVSSSPNQGGLSLSIMISKAITMRLKGDVKT
jgi:hypothetical protein